MRLLSLANRRDIEINLSLKWVQNSGTQMGYGVFYFRSNGLKIRRSNALYMRQTSDFVRSNVLSKRSNVLRRIRSHVAINSGKRKVKLLSVEEIFSFALWLQKLQSVEEITISGKEESKRIFKKSFIILKLFKHGHSVAVCIVVMRNPLLSLLAPISE